METYEVLRGVVSKIEIEKQQTNDPEAMFPGLNRALEIISDYWSEIKRGESSSISDRHYG